MHILHHGAVQGVTGSCHQLCIDEHSSIMVDCGLFQGEEVAAQSPQQLLPITFDISHLQALLVTHCHIDHVGRIPYLLAAGFNGPIFATEATAAMLPLVIEDALKLGVTRNKRLIEKCLKQLHKQLVAVAYDSWVQVALAQHSTATFKVKFRQAGHILGSAYLETEIKHQQTSKRIVFSGDLGAPYTPLLAAPKSPYQADIVVIESTYGDSLHHNRKQRKQQLSQVLHKAVADNGLVLIPAFSIGRTQELLYELEQIIAKAPKSSKLHHIEVIVDSPMAAQFTEYYLHFQQLWDKEAKQAIKQGRHPLDFDSLYTVNSHQDHLSAIEYLSKRNKPAIIIAASGMCNGGRISHYLTTFLDNPKTDVLFVGYQAKGSVGRQIQQYASKPNGYAVIEGQNVAIKAGVHTISGYSAHADQANLINFIKRIYKRPAKVVIVHGDEPAKQALKQKLATIIEQVVIATNKSEL
ncbi:MBL fold metallo-hydrolase RNA specificity domain-containing protein [Paraferrimonas sp. SM1919]|uniref:MBL fold metallo-hydrolase RNA specificity domain-containing protein n=1 Tax=Paraferrimonas sp. SM1919 TaxID=2662263 RepID=UPI0013D6C3C2|nr:MBL fold metallo-hydrolase [Paraferrimonas sp. SM1919]